MAGAGEDGRLFGTREELRARNAALSRYEQWQLGRVAVMRPDQAISAVAALYELLPASSRDRPFDPTGVVTMHERLAALSRFAAAT
ncbi:MAG TPA: hypothetical protein VN634_20550 [Candidatus Limnocylindrales bacterium]|nr:hypothetical protein [Candidatus Limnocylindrales bacterium]